MLFVSVHLIATKKILLALLEDVVDKMYERGEELTTDNVIKK